jgi:biopolymer transport protein ExbB
MENQAGILNFWQQGDVITHIVALLLVGMSVLSWVVIVMKALDIVRLKRMAHNVESFWHSSNLDEGLAALDGAATHTNDTTDANPFYSLAKQGHEASAHHRATQEQLHDSLDVSDWVTRSLRNAMDDSTARLQAGLAVLASIGSTAPFVGLFCTVWGIYHALIGIGASGQVGMDRVAGPIGEALIMTALGLVVAVPAVLGYNALVRGNKFILGQLNRFAHDLHAYLVTGARVGKRDSAGV